MVDVGEEGTECLIEDVGAREGVGDDVGQEAVNGRLQADAALGGGEGRGTDGVGGYRAGGLVEGPRGEGGRGSMGEHVGVGGVDEGTVGGGQPKL